MADLMNRLRYDAGIVNVPRRDADLLSVTEAVRRNVQALLDWRKWNQADLAEKVGRSQPWVSKRLTGKTRMTLDDLDLIAAAFLVPSYSLLHPCGHGAWDRRSGLDRRTGYDRRKAPEDRQRGDLPRRSR